MKILEINHCRKQFDGVEVLKDISLSVDEGQVVSIIGPSGSGKSTLLRCATLLETMDGGDLIYIGEHAAKDSENGSVYASAEQLKKIKSNFGLVFQNFNLFPHYSVMKNITEAPILVQKRNKDEVYEETLVLLKKMGLSDKADSYPYQLSGGQQQRVSIGRAIVKNPDILLCDEPTGALDYQTSKEILKLIEEINQKYGNTIIMVTHNEAIRNMADHVIKLRDGGVRHDDRNTSKVSAVELEW